MSKIKSIDGLMKYLRNFHGIAIKGSTHKKKLRNIGYYHGYKGYRFIRVPTRTIPFTDFNQVLAINKFDADLKSLFYPQIMFIETSLKNYVLEATLESAKTESFNVIYEKVLDYYKSLQPNSKSYKDSIQKRLKLRDKFYSALTREYNNGRQVVQHFYHRDTPVPIWAIFEVISLGEFGNYVSCLNLSVKQKISLSLKLNQSCDADGKLTQNIIYLLKDLRNSIAHNNVIFDTRFKSSQPNHSLIASLQLDTCINNINFETIVDYIILVVFLLKSLNATKLEMARLVNNFESLINDFRSSIPLSIYNRIFYTDTRTKLNLLKNYIRL